MVKKIKDFLTGNHKEVIYKVDIAVDIESYNSMIETAIANLVGMNVLTTATDCIDAFLCSAIAAGANGVFLPEQSRERHVQDLIVNILGQRLNKEGAFHYHSSSHKRAGSLCQVHDTLFFPTLRQGTTADFVFPRRILNGDDVLVCELKALPIDNGLSQTDKEQLRVYKRWVWHNKTKALVHIVARYNANSRWETSTAAVYFRARSDAQQWRAHAQNTLGLQPSEVREVGIHE